MNHSRITLEQRDKILSLEEDHFCDLKSKDIKPARLSECVSSFANTSGGEIYVGVDETGPNKVRRWRGFVDIEEANAHLQVVESLAPLTNHFDVTFLSCDGEDGHVLQLTVHKAKDIIRSTDGTPYVRKGAQKQPVAGDNALERLRLDKGIRSFEDDTLAIPMEEISNSSTTIEFLLNVVPTAEPEPWLRKQKLIDGDKPTVAGVLLFSEEPQASLPKRSAVKIYRYKTKGDVGERDTLAFDPLTIEGLPRSRLLS